MKAVNKTNGNIYRIQQDTNGKWFGYCDRTKEYTPAFVKSTVINVAAFLLITNFSFNILLPPHILSIQTILSILSICDAEV